jgi:hypothetical protein
MTTRLFAIAFALLTLGASAPATRPAEYDPRNPRHAYKHACELAATSPRDAVAELERAVEMGFTDFASIEANPELDPLRDSRRFKRLVARKDHYLRRTAQGTLVALENRFGADGYLYEIDDDQRLIFAVAMDSGQLSSLRDAMRTQAEALHAALFDRKPEAYVTVLMPTAEDYGKLIRFRNVPGLYVDESKSLVARERGYVMVHEYTHALQAADRPPLAPESAPWIAEGLGCLCESADFAGGKFQPRDNTRFATLPHGARRKALIPLERLVAMDKREFIRRPALTYGQSAYLMLYLWEQGLLKKFYDSYKSTCRDDPTGKTALEAVTGKKLPDLHEAWRLWLAGRKPAQ